MPHQELTIIYGFALCFFGSAYPFTVAAVEAWRQCGGSQASICLHDMAAQIDNAVKESALDDQIDDDKDGIADVEQISSKELLKRKIHVALRATDPKIVNDSLKGIYGAWSAVIACLKLEFARTIALGSAIGDFIHKLANIPLTKVMVHFLDDDLHQWIPNIISYTCKIVAIIIAYQIQVIITTFYSSIRGGLMVSRTSLTWLIAKFGWKIDLETSYADEIAGWTLAAIGFYCQFKLGFGAPMLVRLVLWPVGFIEASLIWAVNSGPSPLHF
jgi:hypothetical protein